MTSELKLTSMKPYLIRAWRDWLCDNQLTPLLMIRTDHKDLQIPVEVVGEEDTMILNVSPQAVRDLAVDNEAVRFSTRFSGRAFVVSVPIDAVVAILARGGEPCFFFDDQADFLERRPGRDDSDLQDGNPPDSSEPKGRPGLTLVE